MSGGHFITFEGIDGCGKSTQLDMARQWLERAGLDVVATREPGDTPLGFEIRRLLLDGRHTPCAEAELLLFLADRAQHVRELILPALERGAWVLCDRYSDSTLAYQLAARRLASQSDLAGMLAFAECGCRPELTLWFDLDPEAAAERMRSRQRQGQEASRMDKENGVFHQRVAAGFAGLHQQHPDRICRIDAAPAAMDVHAEVVACLRQRWPELDHG